MVDLNTSVPGTLQTQGLTSSDVAISLTGGTPGLPYSAFVTLTAGSNWVYNSEAGQVGGLTVLANVPLPIPVKIGAATTFYARTATTATLSILTINPDTRSAQLALASATAAAASAAAAVISASAADVSADAAEDSADDAAASAASLGSIPALPGVGVFALQSINDTLTWVAVV